MGWSISGSAQRYNKERCLVPEQEVPEDENKFHGWRIDDTYSLYVGHLPDRKQVAIYYMTRHPWVDEFGGEHTGAAMDIIAYTSDAQALRLIALIDLLVPGEMMSIDGSLENEAY
jgi:hypothetical protein